MRQSECNGALRSRNLVKVCMSRSVYLFHLIGSYNKVFALNFHNEIEVVARLPTALAGAPFFTTAREVATVEREKFSAYVYRAYSHRALMLLQILLVPNILSRRRSPV